MTVFEMYGLLEELVANGHGRMQCVCEHHGEWDSVDVVEINEDGDAVKVA